jgi:transposase
MGELFRVALGLAEPWRISRIEFSAEDRELHLWLDFPSGSKFACPACQASHCGAYDTTERIWRHLNFFQHKTLLHARQPRVQCPEHGIKTVEVPWSRPGSGFTLLLEAFILMLVQGGMNVSQAAALIGEHDTRLWRVLKHYVEKARAEADFSEVTTIGVDETSRRRGHQYITIFMDLDTAKRRVLFVAEGKNAAAVEAFRNDLEDHGGKPEQIEEACVDMSAAFIRGLQDQFPDAALTFDNFHLMQLLNKAVDEVRRDEQRTQPALKGTRYLWLKNEWNLTETQKEQFEQVRGSHLKTARAAQIRGVFQDVFAFKSPEEAEPFLKRWYYWATHSRIPQMVKAARTIKKHWDGVLRWFTSRISNGVVEAVNGLIQSAKRKARGFRSTDYLITMIYLTVGKLDFKLPTPAPATHGK